MSHSEQEFPEMPCAYSVVTLEINSTGLALNVFARGVQSQLRLGLLSLPVHVQGLRSISFQS